MNALKNRWRRLKGLLAFGWFLGFYYGDSLSEYPLGVRIKMLAARLAFLLPLPLLLPDRRFVLNHHGAKMHRQLNSCPIDLDVAWGTYEYWKTRLFSNLVNEGMTILDIGSCEGYYAILFASLMHDKGRVLAFEPDPDNCRWLRTNIATNGYKCIEIHEYALSDIEGETTFHPGGGVGSLIRDSSALSLFHRPRDPVTVRTRTLDNVLRDANIQNVDLIKMDVEGADLLVLKGAQHTLRTMNVRILMDIDVHGDEERELFDLLATCGFSSYRIGKHLKPIRAAHGIPTPSSLKPGHDSPIATSTMNRFKNILPTWIRSVLALLTTVSYPYLSIPVRWFRAPRQIREIYAVKLGDPRFREEFTCTQ